MIEINLLPLEYREKVTHLKLPWKTFVVVTVSILLSFWVFLFWSSLVINRQLRHWKVEWNSLEDQRKKAELLLTEINDSILPKKNYIENIMSSPFCFSELFNVISDVLPQGIWLSELKINKENSLWSLLLIGYAKPVRDQPSMIGSIGNFISEVKDKLEQMLADKEMVPTEGDKKIEEGKFEIQTTTRRKQAEKIEITQFITKFKSKKHGET